MAGLEYRRKKNVDGNIIWRHVKTALTTSSSELRNQEYSSGVTLASQHANISAQAAFL